MNNFARKNKRFQPPTHTPWMILPIEQSRGRGFFHELVILAFCHPSVTTSICSIGFTSWWPLSSVLANHLIESLTLESTTSSLLLGLSTLSKSTTWWHSWLGHSFLHVIPFMLSCYQCCQMAVMVWWFFEKMPPNSGGVVGFKWRRHGGCHRLNGGGRVAVMAEETYFFWKFSQNYRLGRLGLTRPNPKPSFWIKMGWAACELQHEHEQHAPAWAARAAGSTH